LLLCARAPFGGGSLCRRFNGVGCHVADLCDTSRETHAVSLGGLICAGIPVAMVGRALDNRYSMSLCRAEAVVGARCFLVWWRCLARSVTPQPTTRSRRCSTLNHCAPTSSGLVEAGKSDESRQTASSRRIKWRSSESSFHRSIFVSEIYGCSERPEAVRHKHEWIHEKR
jgi:hypothetical protein